MNSSSSSSSNSSTRLPKKQKTLNCYFNIKNNNNNKPKIIKKNKNKKIPKLLFTPYCNFKKNVVIYVISNPSSLLFTSVAISLSNTFTEKQIRLFYVKLSQGYDFIFTLKIKNFNKFYFINLKTNICDCVNDDNNNNIKENKKDPSTIPINHCLHIKSANYLLNLVNTSLSVQDKTSLDVLPLLNKFLSKNETRKEIQLNQSKFVSNTYLTKFIKLNKNLILI